MVNETTPRLRRLFFGFDNRPRYFCIGRNKTGTTSLAKAFSDLGFSVGNQRRAERLLPHYIRGNFKPILRHCRTARVFQDSPFSYPETYRHLDLAFPGSRFILTIRDSAQQWYDSLTAFHSKIFGHGRLPTADDLKQADYVCPGWYWRLHSHLYQTPVQDPYNRDVLTAHYERHNRDIMEYFSGRNDLLVINLSEPGAYDSFCRFIGAEPRCREFPWENRTSEVPVT